MAAFKMQTRQEQDWIPGGTWGKKKQFWESEIGPPLPFTFFEGVDWRWICLSGEARVHSEGEQHGGKLNGRPRQEEQGLRGLHHKGAVHHHHQDDADADDDDCIHHKGADDDANDDELSIDYEWRPWATLVVPWPP